MNLEKIPDNWTVKKVDEIGKVVTGGTPSTDVDSYWGGDIPWLRVTDINEKELYVSNSEDEITEDGLNNGSCSLLKPGSVIVSTRATIGKVAVSEVELATNQGFKSVEPNEDINSEYLAYYFLSIENELEQLGRGATYDEVSKTKFKNIEVPVPPIEEQERIVREIENKIDSIQSTEQKASKLHNLSTEYRNSAFAYLLSGVNMNGIDQNLSLPDESIVPNNWRVCELNEIADRLRSTYETEPGVNYDLYSFEAVDEGKGFFVTDGEEINSRKRELFGGEVLISRLNPRISRVCKVDSESENKQVASTEFVALDLTTNNVSRKFLYQYLKTPLIREYLMNQTTGSTGSHSRVSFDEVMSLPVPIPPEDEQERLITELSEIEQNTQTVEDSVTVVDQYLEEYRKSVLHYALTGELV